MRDGQHAPPPTPEVLQLIVARAQAGIAWNAIATELRQGGMYCSCADLARICRPIRKAQINARSDARQIGQRSYWAELKYRWKDQTKRYAGRRYDDLGPVSGVGRSASRAVAAGTGDALVTAVGRSNNDVRRDSTGRRRPQRPVPTEETINAARALVQGGLTMAEVYRRLQAEHRDISCSQVAAIHRELRTYATGRSPAARAYHDRKRHEFAERVEQIRERATALRSQGLGLNLMQDVLAADGHRTTRNALLTLYREQGWPSMAHRREPAAPAKVEHIKRMRDAGW